MQVFLLSERSGIWACFYNHFEATTPMQWLSAGWFRLSLSFLEVLLAIRASDTVVLSNSRAPQQFKNENSLFGSPFLSSYEAAACLETPPEDTPQTLIGLPRRVLLRWRYSTSSTAATASLGGRRGSAGKKKGAIRPYYILLDLTQAGASSGSRQL